MTKENFKEEQTILDYAEIGIANRRQYLLSQMLDEMTDSERQQLVGYDLGDDNEIIGIDSSGVNYLNTRINNSSFCELKNLSKKQQKGIINSIFGMY
jgi:hypothetical protein